MMHELAMKTANADADRDVQKLVIQKPKTNFANSLSGESHFATRGFHFAKARLDKLE